jgi:V/A-type H+-transporting ATPase subunit D
MWVWRTIRVLEELVLPELKSRIKTITQFIGERERESHFRLKRFKTIQQKKGHDVYEDLARLSP